MADVERDEWIEDRFKWYRERVVTLESDLESATAVNIKLTTRILALEQSLKDAKCMAEEDNVDLHEDGCHCHWCKWHRDLEGVLK